MRSQVTPDHTKMCSTKTRAQFAVWSKKTIDILYNNVGVSDN